MSERKRSDLGPYKPYAWVPRRSPRTLAKYTDAECEERLWACQMEIEYLDEITDLDEIPAKPDTPVDE